MGWPQQSDPLVSLKEWVIVSRFGERGNEWRAEMSYIERVVLATLCSTVILMAWWGGQNLQGVLILDFAMKSIGQGFLCFLASTVSAVLIKDRPVLMLLLSQVLSIVIVFSLDGGRDLL